MSFFITNIKTSAIYNIQTGAIVTPFTRMDSIEVGVDLKMQEVRAGAGLIPEIHIPADRTPKASLKGPEVPLIGMDKVTGMSVTRGATGAPLILPEQMEATVGDDGKVKLTSGKPLSATNTNVQVMGLLDGKTYTTVASAPTSGQFVTPTSGATELQFHTSDAGKIIFVTYYYDSTVASQFDYKSTTIPGIHKFVGTGVMTSNIDETLRASCIVVVRKTQFIGEWKFGAERAKATNNEIQLGIMDPGGGQAAISLYFDAKVVA